MRSIELFRSCANEHVAAAALACIGGKLQKRVDGCGAERGPAARRHGRAPCRRIRSEGRAQRAAKSSKWAWFATRCRSWPACAMSSRRRSKGLGTHRGDMARNARAGLDERRRRCAGRLAQRGLLRGDLEFKRMSLAIEADFGARAPFCFGSGFLALGRDVGDNARLSKRGLVVTSPFPAGSLWTLGRFHAGGAGERRHSLARRDHSGDRGRAGGP